MSKKYIINTKKRKTKRKNGKTKKRNTNRNKITKIVTTNKGGSGSIKSENNIRYSQSLGQPNLNIKLLQKENEELKKKNEELKNSDNECVKDLLVLVNSNNKCRNSLNKENNYKNIIKKELDNCNSSLNKEKDNKNIIEKKLDKCNKENDEFTKSEYHDLATKHNEYISPLERSIRKYKIGDKKPRTSEELQEELEDFYDDVLNGKGTK